MLFAAILAVLRENELADVLQGDDLIASMIEFMAQTRPALREKHDQWVDESPLDVDGAIARDYAAALDAVFTGMARFRARLNGSMTPIVAWAEHFDLSFLWFASEHADESAPHMNFGFAPFGGGIDEPYLYAYAYPMDSKPFPTVPEPAYWHTAGWTGVVVPYPAIARADDPVGYVESNCEATYRALIPIVT
jgi:hypothetical protein